MASSITPTLATAAAQVFTSQNARAEAHAVTATPAQLAQVSQEAAQRTATHVQPDAERTAAIPKKVEANYSPQSVKKKKPRDEDGEGDERAADAPDADEQKQDSPDIDLVA